MKIIYSAGNRIGANSQLERIVSNLNNYEVKIAAYLKSSSSMNHIDWTLDSLHNNILSKKELNKLWSLFGHKNVPCLNLENTRILLLEVAEFKPDLIISDGEPIIAHIAKSLGIKLWYCSPIHLLDGIEWERGQFRYSALLANTKSWLKQFPKADKTFIYSPFGDIKFRPFIKEHYEWITPYHYKANSIGNTALAVINETDRYTSLTKIINCIDCNVSIFGPFIDQQSKSQVFKTSDISNYLKQINNCSNIFITTGETSFIADAFYNNKNIMIAPNLNDYEGLLNSILVRLYQIGSDLGQLEFMNNFALEELEKSISRKYKDNYLSIQSYPFLHEKIEEICNV